LVRILLKFNKEIVDQPITSEIISEQKTKVNILTAHINQDGGEILAEISSENAQKVIEAFRKRGVLVEVRNLIEIDDDLCTSCGSCYSLCPVDAIQIKKDFAIEFKKEKCLGNSCRLCLDSCPTRAIRIIG
jgi:NAD-dependent dihydropyrimidine dehydrogenase PreA subunit